MICLPSRDTSPHDTRTARTQAPTQRQSRAGRRHSRPHHHRYGELDLYTIFVHSKADFLHTPIILLLPPSLSALLTLLHDYCAIYDAPPRTSLCMLYTIHHTMLVVGILCNGQTAADPTTTDTRRTQPPPPWRLPLQDIANTDFVWCMANKKVVGRDRILRTRRAIVLQ